MSVLDGAVLDKPVQFKSVTINKTTGRLGFSVDRENMQLDQAADCFCNRRLLGKVVLGRVGDAEGQTTMVDDAQHEVAGAFDVKGFRTTSEALSSGLTFSLADIAIDVLSLFSNRPGRLVVDEVADIPEEKDDEAADDDRSLFVEGPWADVNLDTLFDPKKKIRKAFAKAEINTVGEYTKWCNDKGEFWAKDLAGIGPAARQEIEDVFIKFWADNPQAKQ
jgi:hypothetical protein